ncbi:MAG: serine/threonine-protein kinase [Anaerolineales bacterium]|nr:serine/threonine-protein kinase [Anaerolineales bacterium]
MNHAVGNESAWSAVAGDGLSSTARLTTLLGQQVGPYQVMARLGGGSMASVFRAIDTRTNRPVAIKVLLPEADAVMRERFRHEARTHSNLIHHNVVPILEVGEVPGAGLTYIAMELVDGPNLSEVMEETPRMQVVDAALLLEPIARALDYASRKGIVHRDVKPSNVLLRRATPGAPGAVSVSILSAPVVPLLSDFGIARALDAPELTSAGRTIGTPTYMSPEQCADSHEIDGRSDLYSLGAVLYRCLVGRPPFSGTTTQILHGHVYEPLLIPEDVLAALPPLAVHVLQHSLAKDPDQRYATGAEMAAELRLVAAGVAVNQATNSESTSTMPSLAVVKPAVGQAVLVPAPEATTMTATAPILVAAPAGPYIAAEPLPPRGFTPLAAPPPRPRRRWAGALIGALLAGIVIVVGGSLMLNLLPNDLIARLPATPTTAVNPVVVVATTAVAPVTVAASPVVGTPETAPGASGTETLVSTPKPVTPAATLPFTATVPLLATPVGAITDYWTEVQTAYAEQDWQTALLFVPMVRRIDPNFERAAIDKILLDVHLGLSAEQITQGAYDKASIELGEAAKLQPDAQPVKAIQRALDALVSPNTLNKSMARWSLATELLTYGQTLKEDGNPCLAAEHLQAALSVLPDSDVGDLYTESVAECARLQAAAAFARQVGEDRGSILYSTQEGNRFAIYRAPMELDGPATLTIADGTQPARQDRGNLVAFHSPQPATEGVASFALGSGIQPDERTGRITTNAMDAVDAPPSWDPAGKRLVFESTWSGSRRLYVAESAKIDDLGPGRDPAWHPFEDKIVFNGTNDVGGEPGLWLMDSAGGDRERLTGNGDDRRPTWAPDGKFLIYMSQRNGNWDLYRLDLATRDEVRLTDNPAQDGLPSVSPDGKWVAFASDRAGFWQIWVMPSQGGDEIAVMTIKGVLLSWLEHAIQWIP